MHKHSRLICVTAFTLTVVGGAAQAQNANIPLVKDKGPAGQATISTGLGPRGLPESISVGAQHGPVSGGLSVNTGGGIEGSFGVQSGSHSASVTGSTDPSGNNSVGVVLQKTF